MDERPDHFGLAPCPFCGGRVLFCGYEGSENCSGCHYIVCQSCTATVDLSLAADPNQDSVALTQLRRLIVPLWNKRAHSAGAESK